MIERVYFETNSLSGRWPNVSGELEILATLAGLAGVRLCVPKSVIVEHEYSTARRVGEHIDKARKEIANANLLLNSLYTLDSSQFGVGEFQERHRAAVAEACKRYGFVITPTSAKTLDQFIEFGAKHAPPFKPDDKGFRDAVHIHSIIEHLRLDPLTEDGESVFVTTDGRFGKSDVTDMIRRAGVKLKIVQTMSEAIGLVRQGLSEPTREQLGKLVGAWQPVAYQQAQEDLLPVLFRNLKGVQLQPGRRIVEVSVASLQWVDTATSVAPSTHDIAPEYLMSFELYVDTYCAMEFIEAATTRVSDTHLGLLVSVDATVLTDEAMQPKKMDFRSARVFSVRWLDNKAHYENLDPSIELLGIG